MMPLSKQELHTCFKVFNPVIGYVYSFVNFLNSLLYVKQGSVYLSGTGRLDRHFSRPGLDLKTVSVAVWIWTASIYLPIGSRPGLI